MRGSGNNFWLDVGFADDGLWYNDPDTKTGPVHNQFELIKISGNNVGEAETEKNNIVEPGRCLAARTKQLVGEILTRSFTCDE